MSHRIINTQKPKYPFAMHMFLIFFHEFLEPLGPTGPMYFVLCRLYLFSLSHRKWRKPCISTFKWTQKNISPRLSIVQLYQSLHVYSNISPVLTQFLGTFFIRARICNLLRSPGIDSWIPQTITNWGSGFVSTKMGVLCGVGVLRFCRFVDCMLEWEDSSQQRRKKTIFLWS